MLLWIEWLFHYQHHWWVCDRDFWSTSHHLSEHHLHTRHQSFGSSQPVHVKRREQIRWPGDLWFNQHQLRARKSELHDIWRSQEHIGLSANWRIRHWNSQPQSQCPTQCTRHCEVCIQRHNLLPRYHLWFDTSDTYLVQLWLRYRYYTQSVHQTSSNTTQTFSLLQCA